MTNSKIYSSLDVIYWFFHKFGTTKTPADKQKTQHLLFLSQMHYLLKNKKILFASFFISDKNCFYEPTLLKIIQTGFPLNYNFSMNKTDCDFLDLIWQKYSPLSANELNTFIEKFYNFIETTENAIINPFEILKSFSDFIQVNHEKTSFTKSKIMLSQNGPVRVTEWKPRKINNNQGE